MLETQSKHELDQVLACSEGMIEDAKDGNWEKVARAEEKRRSLLNSLFSNPANVSGVSEINHIIEKIIFINKRLENLAIDAREMARVDMDKMRTGRMAVNCYAQNL